VNGDQQVVLPCKKHAQSMSVRAGPAASIRVRARRAENM
jgi:hypothetical protein